jgi:hypothetical protein
MMLLAIFASRTRLGRLLRQAAAVALLSCMGLTGCQSCNLMGSGFSDNSLGDQVRGYRKPDTDTEYAGVSNKSQQIEKDLGVQ